MSDNPYRAKLKAMAPLIEAELDQHFPARAEDSTYVMQRFAGFGAEVTSFKAYLVLFVKVLALSPAFAALFLLALSLRDTMQTPPLYSAWVIILTGWWAVWSLCAEKMEGIVGTWRVPRRSERAEASDLRFLGMRFFPAKIL